MSGFLKPELASNGAANGAAPAPIPVTVTQPQASHVPSSEDVGELVESVHQHIETLVSEELANIKGTLSAAWRSTEEALRQARAELEDLRRQHEALKVLHADAERKAALLDEIKKKLSGA